MGKNVHIVQKQRYEIKTRKQQTALDIQNRIVEINTYYVLPALVEIMDRYVSPGEVLTIDKVELDLGKIKIDAADDVWIKKITESFSDHLKTIGTAENQNERKQRGIHLAESWIWFLKNGMLQANSIYGSLSEINEELLILNENNKKLIRAFLLDKADGNIIKRLVANTDLKLKKIHLQLFFQDADVDWMITKIEEKIQLIRGRKRSSKNDLKIYKQFLWENVFKYLSSNEHVKMPAQDLFVKIEKLVGEFGQNENSVLPLLTAKAEAFIGNGSVKVNSEKVNEELMSGREIFIANSGLCLLTPWLHSFFKETGLVIENRFVDEWKQQHAVFLLNYLVTQKEDATEDLLILPKLLCEWPLQMPIINSFEITEQEKIECDDLLNSVIQNWEVLKNTSIAGLRESFLQRPGKLTDNEDQFVLQPEQQSIDLLLEYIPWTFRFIRLPWMKKAIKVDWY